MIVTVEFDHDKGLNELLEQKVVAIIIEITIIGKQVTYIKGRAWC